MSGIDFTIKATVDFNVALFRFNGAASEFTYRENLRIGYSEIFNALVSELEERDSKYPCDLGDIFILRYRKPGYTSFEVCFTAVHDVVVLDLPCTEDIVYNKMAGKSATELGLLIGRQEAAHEARFLEFTSKAKGIKIIPLTTYREKLRRSKS